MDTLQKILTVIFGDSPSISGALSLIVVILTPIITAFYGKMKNKLTANTLELSLKDDQVKKLENKLAENEKCTSYLCSIITTAYLSSNTIPADVKKQLANYAKAVDKIAGVDLSKPVEKVIEAMSEYVPDLNEKKEEILKATDEVEEVLDEVNEKTQDAIDNILL